MSGNAIARKSLLAAYRSCKQQQEEEHKKHLVASLAKENEVATAILSAIESYGPAVSRLSHNDYTFHFDIGGYRVEFVNQTDRIVAESYLIPETGDEVVMLADSFIPDYLKADIDIAYHRVHQLTPISAATALSVVRAILDPLVVPAPQKGGEQ